MPRFDGTGPAGTGQMTGRQMGKMGNCQNTNQNKTFGCGLGRGQARKIGNGNSFGFNQNAMPQNDISLLKSQAKILQNNLNIVNQRISELENK